MEFTGVEAFLAVARAGQLTRAALALGLSQPAVSRRIELLEADLGVRLFDRRPRGVRLTPAGVALLPHAEQIAATATDARRAVRDTKDVPAGDVAVAVVGTLASGRLPDRLRAFRQRFPTVRLSLVTARSDDVSRMVREGRADLGVRYFADESPGLVSHPAGTEELALVCAGDHPLAGRADATTAVTIDDLAGLTWVTYPVGVGASGEPFARHLHRTLAGAGLSLAGAIEIDSLTAQKRLIEAGFGVGLLPVTAIEEETRIGSLVVVPVGALGASIPIVAIHRREAHLTAPARRLLALLTGDPSEPGSTQSAGSSR